MKKKIVSLALALTMLLTLASCDVLSLKPGGSSNGSSTSTGNDKEGYIGDTLSTYWFDFTVDDAYICDEYEGYTPASGYQLVVVEMTLKNRVTFSVDMYRGDFPILWDDEENGLDYPLAYIGGDQFPDEYTLGINQKKSGELVYEVPTDYRDFSVAFLEIFEDENNEDGRDGDVFFVDFTPEKR